MVVFLWAKVLLWIGSVSTILQIPVMKEVWHLHKHEGLVSSCTSPQSAHLSVLGLHIVVCIRQCSHPPPTPSTTVTTCSALDNTPKPGYHIDWCILQNTPMSSHWLVHYKNIPIPPMASHWLVSVLLKRPHPTHGITLTGALHPPLPAFQPGYHIDWYIRYIFDQKWVI